MNNNLFNIFWNPNINHYVNQYGQVISDDNAINIFGLPVPPYTGLNLNINGSTILVFGLLALILFK